VTKDVQRDKMQGDKTGRLCCLGSERMGGIMLCLPNNAITAESPCFVRRKKLSMPGRAIEEGSGPPHGTHDIQCGEGCS
jgi:hypothetical protein